MEIDEAVEQIQQCVKWSKGWAEANPDPVVADAVEDGLVTLGCLPKARLQRMLKSETLEPRDLSESQMQFLNQKGLLDPEEAETVDDSDEEGKADDDDDSGVSLDDLDEEERERLIEEMREEIEEQMTGDEDGDSDDGADADEEPAEEEPEAEEETEAGLEDFRDGGDDDDLLMADEAM